MKRKILQKNYWLYIGIDDLHKQAYNGHIYNVFFQICNLINSLLIETGSECNLQHIKS